MKEITRTNYHSCDTFINSLQKHHACMNNMSAIEIKLRYSMGKILSFKVNTLSIGDKFSYKLTTEGNIEWVNTQPLPVSEPR